MKKMLTIAAATVAALALTVGGATAGSLITSKDIKDGAVHRVDLSSGVQSKLDRVGTRGPAGPAGPVGATGEKGDRGPRGEAGRDGTDGLLGAFYATAAYNVGDTNAGAIATVACDADSAAFTAIAGGVQTLGLGAGTAPAAVASSFPGRMDWDTNTPKADRLDGWIVQFDADTAPAKATVWALCVPKTNIPVVQTYAQVG